MTALAPVRRELIVDAEPAVAFAVFTDRIGSWWPVAQLSVYGAGSAVAFQDGRIVEKSAGHTDSVWGTVTAWSPPTSIAFTWHPGAEPERASRVSVTFTSRGEQTLVQLEHAGWEIFADPAAARTEYDHGWPTVLEAFAAAVPAATPSTAAAQAAST